MSCHEVGKRFNDYFHSKEVRQRTSRYLRRSRTRTAVLKPEINSLPCTFPVRTHTSYRVISSSSEPLCYVILWIKLVISHRCLITGAVNSATGKNAGEKVGSTNSRQNYYVPRYLWGLKSDYYRRLEVPRRISEAPGTVFYQKALNAETSGELCDFRRAFPGERIWRLKNGIRVLHFYSRVVTINCTFHNMNVSSKWRGNNRRSLCELILVRYVLLRFSNTKLDFETWNCVESGKNFVFLYTTIKCKCSVLFRIPKLKTIIRGMSDVGHYKV